YTVTTLIDETDNGATLSLREAILLASADPGAIITFADDLEGSIVLGSDLPAIVVDMTIDGDGRITIDGAGSYRGLFVYSGEVRVENLFIENAMAKGGDGGSGGALGGGGGAGLG